MVQVGFTPATAMISDAQASLTLTETGQLVSTVWWRHSQV